MKKKKGKAVKGKSKTRRPSGKAKSPRLSRARSKSKAAKVKAAKVPEASLEKIGEVTHYFPHVKAAAVLILKDGLKAGDSVYIKGHTTDFKEKVNSMQLDHVSIQ